MKADGREITLFFGGEGRRGSGHRVSLYSPGQSKTCCVEHGSLELTEPPASASLQNAGV